MLQSSSFEKKKKVKPLIIAHFGPNLHKKWVRMQGCWGVGGSPPTNQKFVHQKSVFSFEKGLNLSKSLLRFPSSGKKNPPSSLIKMSDSLSHQAGGNLSPTPPLTTIWKTLEWTMLKMKTIFFSEIIKTDHRLLKKLFYQNNICFDRVLCDGFFAKKS